MGSCARYYYLVLLAGVSLGSLPSQGLPAASPEIVAISSDPAADHHSLSMELVRNTNTPSERDLHTLFNATVVHDPW